MTSMKWALLGSATLAVCGTAAQAQDEGLSRNDRVAQIESEGGLETIVVTARRRVESIQNVPANIQAFSAKQLDRQNLNTIEKIASTTPQLSIGRAANGSGAQIFLRGIGTTATSIDQAQSVALIVDNVYYEHGRIIDEGFFDLERVEILKGPQALFFGKNATAGAISITTAGPTDTPEYMLRAGYEFNAQELYGEAIASGPLGETLGGRIAIRGSKAFGGLFSNRAQDALYTFTDIATGNQIQAVGPAGPHDVPKRKELLGRITLEWEPIPNLVSSLKASGTISDNNDPGYNYVPYRCPSGVSSLNPAAPCSTRKFNVYHNQMPGVIADSGFPFARDGNLYNRYRSISVTAGFEYDLDSVTITSINNYNWNRNSYDYKGEFQSGPAANIWATENTSFRAYSSELRVRTDFDAPLNLLVGGYYQNTRRKFGQYVANAGLFDSSIPEPYTWVAFDKISGSHGETVSAFGQVLWNIVPKIEVTGGIRYIHETKDGFFRHEHVFVPFQSVFVTYDPSDPTSQIDSNQTFSNWSPEVTLTYRPTEDVTIYGAFKSAYKSGGFSGSAIFSGLSADPQGDFEFAPETASGFEIGFKSVLMNNQLRLNLAAYTYKYKDVQVEYFNPVIFALRNYNAGSIRTKGAELSAEFAPYALDGFSVHGEIAYNKATYGDFPAPCYTGQTPAQGCTALGVSGDPFQNLDGRTPAMAPRWAGNFGIAYETPLNDGLFFAINADARYSGSYYASAFDSPYSKVDNYMTIDAAVRVGSSNDAWEIALIGKNLTNRLYITGLLEGPNTGSGTGTPDGVFADQFGFAAPPRTVQVQVTTRF